MSSTSIYKAQIRALARGQSEDDAENAQIMPRSTQEEENTHQGVGGQDPKGLAWEVPLNGAGLRADVTPSP